MENILILKNIFEETKKDYNNIIIIDVESTCWKDDKDKKDQQSEIIEIGICQINDGVLIKRPSIFIIPEHSTVSPFCTSLTSLTQNQIEKNGLSPTLAYNKLQKEFIYNEVVVTEANSPNTTFELMPQSNQVSPEFIDLYNPLPILFVYIAIIFIPS